MKAILTPIAQAGYLLYECVQGTPEWLACRAGVVTASEFKKARARMKVAREGKLKGDFTDAALDYAFQKALERISGVPLDSDAPVTWQMKKGTKLEPLARMAHESLLEQRGGELADVVVQSAGFMTTPDGLFGCSVDGLIGAHGGSEYKCLSSASKLRKVIMDEDISDYMDQIQGCMWISGRRWWHFGLYCTALRPVGMEFQMVDVSRDDDYIDALEMDLLAFNKVVEEYKVTLEAKGAAFIEEAAEMVRASLAEPASEREPAEEVF